MSQSVQMPALGESVTEGTVTRWLKSEGDEVAVDEPLLEVSTDKVDTEIPSPVAGVLEKILVAEDDTVEVGADLAMIGDGSGGGGDGGGDGDDSADDSTDSGASDDSADSGAAASDSGAAEPADGDSDAGGDAGRSQPEGGDSSSGSGDSGGGGGSGTPVTLPEMGESVTEGTVTRWLKAVGDEVAVDEPLLEVSTDKVDTEIPSPVAGTLLEIVAEEDETVEVGGRLAMIGSADAGGSGGAPEPDSPSEQAESQPEQRPEPEPEPKPKQQAEQQAAPEPEPKQPAPDQQTPSEQRQPQHAADEGAPKPTESLAPARGGQYVTPVIRKLAADNDVDLSSVQGTGVGGRIRREDVLRAAEAAKTAAATPAQTAATPAAGAARPPAGRPVPDEKATALIGTTQKTPRIRQSIAKNMVAALQTAAQLTSVVEVDVTRVAQLRARAKASFEAREGVKLSFLPFFVKAAVEAAKVYPVINSTLSDDLKEITYHPAVNLGIAVDTPRGLIVPVIKSADDLNIGGIARRIADLADRTRNNKIGPDDLSGGTFSITNTGSVGALFDTAIFTPPQSAILITGAVVKRPVVLTDADGNESVAVRSMAYLALSYDHRNIDGADAARYLGAVKRRIEDGEFEGDLGL